MVETVDEGFEDFLNSIRTTTAETRAAAGHRQSIEAKLKAEFDMTSFFRTGSFGSGTNVAGFSDVDYFAVIPRYNLKQNSASTLAAIAAALRDRFPNTENIRVDSPGVRIPFGLDGAETTEVVPVDETGTTALGYRTFDIPDDSGGWMVSAPHSHKAYVDWIDEKHAGQVKPLIRFMKAWKYMRNVPIKSFYLEIRTAHYADGEFGIIYDMDIDRLFRLLLDERLPDVRDPRFPNDDLWLTPCNTDLQRIQALNSIAWASQWAGQAVVHRQNNRMAQAFERWSLVFNHEFPTYTGQ